MSLYIFQYILSYFTNVKRLELMNFEASLIECHILIEFTLLIIFQLKITKLSDGEIEPNRVY